MDTKTYQGIHESLGLHEKNEKKKKHLASYLLNVTIPPLSLCLLMAFLAMKLLLWFVS